MTSCGVAQELSIILEVMQALVATDVFPDWLAVVSGGCWLLLGEMVASKVIALVTSRLPQLPVVFYVQILCNY